MDGFAASKTGYTELEASSEAVGLPEGLMGNSEVGHLNIGAGRVVWQDVVRIDACVRKGQVQKGEIANVRESFEKAKAGNGRLHLLGLVSDGGVHSKLTHLLALLDCAKSVGVPEVFIHFFGDGRDTDPKSGAGHLETVIKKTEELGLGKIATVVGRYYAMDRDKRWERVNVALEALTLGKGEVSEDPVAVIRKRYELNEQSGTDEFLTPIIVNGDEARVKGTTTLPSSHSQANAPQTTTPSSSSTTAPIASAKSPRSSASTPLPSPSLKSPPTSTSPP